MNRITRPLSTALCLLALVLPPLTLADTPAAVTVPTADASDAQPARATPAAVVEELHAALLTAMREGTTLGFAGRMALLAPVIAACFDFETIASIVTGRAWKSASEQQRRDFLDVFSRLSIATYATNFADYAGEHFVTGETEESRGARIVRTRLETSTGENVSLNYMLRERDANWRIINVVAQGVSDLSLKRAEYAAVIESDGFDTLIQRLRAKLAEVEAG